jgi:hypothetical protein
MRRRRGFVEHLDQQRVRHVDARGSEHRVRRSDGDARVVGLGEYGAYRRFVVQQRAELPDGEREGLRAEH